MVPTRNPMKGKPSLLSWCLPLNYRKTSSVSGFRVLLAQSLQENVGITLPLLKVCFSVLIQFEIHSKALRKGFFLRCWLYILGEFIKEDRSKE